MTSLSRRLPRRLLGHAALVVALATIPFEGLAASQAVALPSALAPSHARLEAVTPGDGSSVTEIEEVTLTFNEKVNAKFAQVTVTSASEEKAVGRARVEGGTVRQRLATNLAPGRYRITYRVVSVDGHPISGSSQFTVLTAPSPSLRVDPAPADATPTLTVATPSSQPTDAPHQQDGTVPDIALLTGAALAVVALVSGGVALARRRIRQ